MYVPCELLRKRRGKLLGCLDHASLMILRSHSGRDVCVARGLEYFIHLSMLEETSGVEQKYSAPLTPWPLSEVLFVMCGLEY